VEEWHCLDICLRPETGDISGADLTAFLRDVRRMARDHGLVPHRIEVQGPALHVGCGNPSVFEKIWEAIRTRA
jgi:hypothetical protein